MNKPHINGSDAPDNASVDPEQIEIQDDNIQDSENEDEKRFNISEFKS